MIDDLIKRLESVLSASSKLPIAITEVFRGTSDLDRVYQIRPTSPDQEASHMALLHWFLANHPNLVFTFWKNSMKGCLAAIDFVEIKDGPSAKGFVFHLSDLPEIIFLMDPEVDQLIEVIQEKLYQETGTNPTIDKTGGNVLFDIPLTQAQKDIYLSAGFSVGSSYQKRVTSVMPGHLAETKMGITHKEDGKPLLTNSNNPENRFFNFNNRQLAVSDISVSNYSYNSFFTKYLLANSYKGHLMSMTEHKQTKGLCLYRHRLPEILAFFKIDNVPLFAKFESKLGGFGLFSTPGRKWIENNQAQHNKQGSVTFLGMKINNDASLFVDPRKPAPTKEELAEGIHNFVGDYVKHHLRDDDSDDEDVGHKDKKKRITNS